MFLNVEIDGLEVQVHGLHFHTNVLKEHMLPSARSVLHNGAQRVVELVVLDVQVSHGLPLLVLFAHADQAWDVHPRREQLEVLHESLRAKARIQGPQLGENAHVGLVAPHPGLCQGDQLIHVPASQVEL